MRAVPRPDDVDSLDTRPVIQLFGDQALAGSPGKMGMNMEVSDYFQFREIGQVMIFFVATLSNTL